MAVRKRTYSGWFNYFPHSTKSTSLYRRYNFYFILHKKEKEGKKEKKRENYLYIHILLICIDLDVYIHHILLKYNFIDFLFSLNIDALIYIIILEYFNSS